MRKWVIAGAALVTLCVAVLIAILNINSLIDRNRAYLLARAEQALGRKIRAGDIELTLWRGVGLRVHEFAIADDPEFSTGDFVHARDGQFHLRLLPLFRGRFEIKRVLLHDPAITVIRNAAGVFNFASLSGRDERKEKTRQRERKGEKSGDAGELRLALADISNGEITYRDQKDRTELVVRQIDLAVKHTGAETAFIKLQAALFAEKRNLELEANVADIGAADWRDVRVDGEMTVDPLDLTQLRSAAPGIGVALPKELSAAGLLSVKRLKLKGSRRNLEFNGTANGTDTALAWGKVFNKPAGVTFEIAADGGYADGRAHFRKADVKLHGVEATAKGEITFGGVTAVNLTLDSKRSSLAGLDQIFPALGGYELAGSVEAHTTVRGNIGQSIAPDVQGHLTLSDVSAKPPQWPQSIRDWTGKVNFTGRRASVRDSSATLGSAKVRWSGDIESFAPLKLTYSLSTPELRPAEFQSVPAEARRRDVLKNFSSQGSLMVQRGGLILQAKMASSDGDLFNIAYEQLESGVALADNVLNIRGLRFNALRGALFADGEYVMTETPRFTVTSKLQGIDLNESYRVFSPESHRDVQGRLKADVKLAGTGRNWQEIKPNLRGQGIAEVIDGALLDFNLVDAALSATGFPGVKNLISPQVRKKYPETFEAKDTKFKELKGRFDVSGGRVNVKDLTMAAPDYSIQGEGWADFDRRVDFRSSLILSQRLSADLAQSAREIRFLFNERNEFEMPLTVSGTLPNVKTRPDSTYVARALQRGFLGQGVEQLERRLFGKKDPAPNKDDDQPVDDSKKRRRRDTEDLIRRGLENLFKRN